MTYLLFPLLLLASRRLSAFVSLLGTATYIALMVAVRSEAGLGSWTTATFDFGAMRAIPLFFVGILIERLVRGSSWTWSPSWTVLHATFLLIVGLLLLGTCREFCGVLMALLIIGAALAERSGKSSFLCGRLMGHLGDTSYAFYLVHVLVAVPIVHLLRRHGLLATTTAWGVAGVTLIATIILAHFIFRWFERPLREALRPKQMTSKKGDAAPDHVLAAQS